jgi:hypothetical protein
MSVVFGLQPDVDQPQGRIAIKSANDDRINLSDQSTDDTDDADWEYIICVIYG